MKPLKTVVDTNLFIAARWNPKSNSARILTMVQEGKLVLVYNSATKRELEKILQNVKALPEFIAKVEALLALGIDVGETEKLNIITDDPDDNKFLACAKAADADYIISNDEHLLVLREFGSSKIVTSGQFMARYAEGA